MSQQRRRTPSSIFEYQSENEAFNLRRQAEGMPNGIRRDELMRMANRIDVTALINERLPAPFQLSK